MEILTLLVIRGTIKLFHNDLLKKDISEVNKILQGEFDESIESHKDFEKFEEVDNLESCNLTSETYQTIIKEIESIEIRINEFTEIVIKELDELKITGQLNTPEAMEKSRDKFLLISNDLDAEIKSIQARIEILEEEEIALEAEGKICNNAIFLNERLITAQQKFMNMVDCPHCHNN